MAREEAGENSVGESPEIDLDAVKAEIMEEVEELRKRRGGVAWMPESSAGSVSVQPSEQIMRIMDLDNASFLRTAYQIVLGRTVDSSGYVDGMDRLIEGESRSDVLWSLAESVEARSKGVDASALLGDRASPSLPRTVRKRSFLRRVASWANGLRHAPARIEAMGHDLRRVSLKVDWLLDQNAALEASRTEVSLVIDRQVHVLESDLYERLTGTLDVARADLLSAADRQAQGLESVLNERLARLQGAWEEVSEGLQRQMDVAAEQYRSLVGSSEASVSESRRAIEDIRQLERRLLMDEVRLLTADARANVDRLSVLPGQTPSSAPAQLVMTDPPGELLYLALEDAFRGTDALIRDRLQLYVSRVAACAAGTTDSPVIDLGCGRGEWLQLLKEQGYLARGADTSAIMTGLCRAKGLDVDHADAVDYLSHMKPSSVGMITAFQVIEHVPFEKLLQIVDLSLRALRPGGMLILETPNPENMVVATCNFYVDPTHVRPIPPDLLEFLVKARGFSEVETLRLHPLDMVKRGEQQDEWLNPVLDRFNCSQDYAVVGVRPGPGCDTQGHDVDHGATA